MDIINQVHPKVIASLYEQFFADSKNLISATKYLSSRLVVRLVRKRANKNAYDKKKPKVFKLDNSNYPDFVLSLGAPNYLERNFIKLCKKSGVSFPIKNPILKHQSKI